MDSDQNEAVIYKPDNAVNDMSAPSFPRKVSKLEKRGLVLISIGFFCSVGSGLLAVIVPSLTSGGNLLSFFLELIAILGGLLVLIGMIFLCTFFVSYFFKSKERKLEMRSNTFIASSLIVGGVFLCALPTLLFCLLLGDVCLNFSFLTQWCYYFGIFLIILGYIMLFLAYKRGEIVVRAKEDLGQKKGILWWTLVPSLLQAPLILPAMLLAPIFGFATGDPSAPAALSYLLIVLVTTYPLMLLIGFLGGIFFSFGVRNKRRNIWAFVLAYIPLLPAIYLFILFDTVRGAVSDADVGLLELILTMYKVYF